LLHPVFQRRQRLSWHAAAAALVGEGRVGEAIADDDRAARQRRLDLPAQVVAPRGEHQQRFAQAVHFARQHQRAQFSASGVPPGSRVSTTSRPRCAQPFGQPLDVRRLAGAVDAFEADETSGAALMVCRAAAESGRPRVRDRPAFR
jgi:hypothetical protein